MGITKLSYNHFIRILSEYTINTKKMNLIELGIQESAEPMNFHYLRDSISTEFESYISLDLHSTAGVTRFDLSEYCPEAFQADIITNFGTTKHVEYERGQYNCWLNIHNLNNPKNLE